MPVTVVLAKAHKEQLADPEVRQELDSINAIARARGLDYEGGVICCDIIRGMYKHDEQFMITVCLFVNKLDRPVKAIYGDIAIQFKHVSAQAALMSVQFDEDFLGVLAPDEAALVHLHIPVRGLDADRVFESTEITGSFQNLRVAYADEPSEE